MQRPPSAREIKRLRMDRAWEYARASGSLSESPIEEHLKSAISAVISTAKDVRLDQQVEVAGYRLDFVIRGPESIAIECDGRDFHSRAKDRPREQHILSTGAVARIYRLPGSAIFNAVQACLAVVAVLDPWVFSRDSRDSRLHESAGRLRADGAVATTPLGRLQLQQALGAALFELPPTVPHEHEWQLSWGPQTPLDDATVITVVGLGR